MFQKLYDNTWFLDDQGVRIFLAAGKEKALIIDTGISGLDIIAEAKKVTELPLELINTHSDMDHMAGNESFEFYYMHPSELCAFNRKRTGMIRPVFEGDSIDLGGRVLNVVHVPGHTPGSITLMDRENRCILGGDPVQQDGEIFMFGPYRDMESYIFGLNHLLTFDFDLVYPSHAVMPVGRDVISELITAAQKILNGEIAGENKELFGQKVTSYDAGVARFLCDRI